MKFKELSEKDKKFITDTYNEKDTISWEKRAASLGDKFGVSERTIRKWVSEKLNLKEKNTPEPEQYEKAKEKQHDKTKNRFIVTWAQNNTPVHKEFFDNIKSYANFINADIHVIAGRYKNLSLYDNKDKHTQNEWWYPELLPYLDANRHNLHKYMSIMSDIKIQPTATNPMSGLQGVSGINSCVFGSPKVHLEMIPVLEGCKPKMMLTTGSVTKMNYSDSKAGKKGEFHHTYGFVIIEIKDKDTFYVRQVTADDKSGNFTDLCYRVENSKVSKIDSLSAIILGDLHFGYHDKNLINITNNFLSKIKPEHVVLHDVFDGISINHHDIKDPFIQFAKEKHNKNSLEKEVDEMLSGLDEFSHYNNVVIVRSNHDDFLDRWLKNEDWKKQPTTKNSKLYMQYSTMLLEQYEKDMEHVCGVIPEIIKRRFPKFVTLRRNESYIVKKWELGQHGDQGFNGARGSLNQFRTLNTKIIVGHSHTPGRKDGAASVGTSTTLRMGYNVGPSSWLQSHILLHNDGRIQHMNFLKDMNNELGFTTFEI